MDEKTFSALEAKVGTVITRLGELREERDRLRAGREELERKLAELHARNEELDRQLARVKENSVDRSEVDQQRREVEKRVEDLLGRFEALGDLEQI